MNVDDELLDGLDDGQVAAVVAMLSDPRPVITVVGPAGAGKTTMLAAAVTSWHRAGISVFGVGPSATAARQLRDGAGTVADTLHKLVYEHSVKQTAGRGPADAMWDLPARSVVIIDESGMVDTRLLHDYAQIARAKQWRTVLVGDHRQLDAVDAGGMFAELVGDPDVVSVELDTLHRFHHEWEADASLRLRDGDPEAIAVYDSHGRIHGHLDHAAAVDAVADAAYVGLVEGRDVLVMAPTNAVVDELNATLTERLLAAERLDAERRDRHRRSRVLSGSARRHPSQQPHHPIRSWRVGSQRRPLDRERRHTRRAVPHQHCDRRSARIAGRVHRSRQCHGQLRVHHPPGPRSDGGRSACDRQRPHQQPPALRRRHSRTGSQPHPHRTTSDSIPTNTVPTSIARTGRRSTRWPQR